MLIPLPSTYGCCVELFRWERVLATGVGVNVVEDLQPGDPPKIGPYRLVGRLGQGGMGQVFLGVSPGGRPVAVKAIRPDLAADPRFRVRFAREVAAARRVSGMFTAMVVDADVDGRVAWLATAYVPGPSLSEAVESHGPLPEASLLALAAGLAESLIAIHAAGVIHRDLKPSNVLLAEDGPRVIDFGISRAAAESTALTQTGLVVGSPGFMSPEQAMGGAVGPSSDIFSLGAVLAFAATGQGPFGTGTTVTLLYRVVHGAPDLEQVPPAVRPLIERCLAKNPAERPTAAELLTEAGALQVGGNWLPESITQTIARDPRLGPAAAASGAGLAGLAVGYAATSPIPESAQAPGPDAVPTQTAALGSAAPASAAGAQFADVSDSAATTPGIGPPPPADTPPQAAAEGTGGGKARPKHRFLRPLVLGGVAGAVFAISAATAFALTSSAGKPPATHQSPAAQVSAVPAGHSASSAPASAGATSRAGATHTASGSASSSAFTSPSASGSASLSASPSPNTSGSASASASSSPSSLSSSSSSASPSTPASSSPPVSSSPTAPASSSAPPSQPASPSAPASSPAPAGS